MTMIDERNEPQTDPGEGGAAAVGGRRGYLGSGSRCARPSVAPAARWRESADVPSRSERFDLGEEQRQLYLQRRKRNLPLPFPRAKSQSALQARPGAARAARIALERGALTYPRDGGTHTSGAPHGQPPGWVGQTYLTCGPCSRAPASDFGSWRNGHLPLRPAGCRHDRLIIIVLVSSSSIVFIHNCRSHAEPVLSALNRRRRTSATQVRANR